MLTDDSLGGGPLGRDEGLRVAGLQLGEAEQVQEVIHRPGHHTDHLMVTGYHVTTGVTPGNIIDHGHHLLLDVDGGGGGWVSDK